MEIAENITWTEELERLDVLLSQGQFELLLPGERCGGGEKEIWLVYLMNDAAESFLVFHDAELTGTYQKEYEGEIDAALEKDGEQYVLIVRQKETVCTLFFSRLSLEVHLFDYGKTGHFWVDGYEYLRQIEFRIAILRDKLEYLGEHRGRNASGIAGQFPAAQFLLLPGRAGSVSRTVMPVVGSDGRGNYGDEKTGIGGRR